MPLESGAELARRNNVYDKLAPIFEFVSGNESPPPAPKHTTSKPKVPKKPAVPKFNASEWLDSDICTSKTNDLGPVAAPPLRQQPQQHMPMPQEEYYDNMSVQYERDNTPDDTTVASFMDDDRYDMSAPPSQRKRKRDVSGPALSHHDQAHLAYSDELLDYFMLAQGAEQATRPEPPPNFDPNWTIDSEGHTALHWAAAMGDLDVMKQLKSFNAQLDARNIRGETPLIRAMLFTNSMDKQSMPRVVHELISTIKCQDNTGQTAFHHAVGLTATRNKHHCARYYLDVLLNKIVEVFDHVEVTAILDVQDVNGNTAAHIAAKNKARKCLRAIMGRGANIELADMEGTRVEQLIQGLNASRRSHGNPNGLSSSPYAPQSSRRNFSYPEPAAGTPQLNLTSVLQSARRESHHSEAAQTVSSKVTPLVIQKFQDLAKSFDEELRERENSEKEARRILSQSQAELAAVQRAIEEFGESAEDRTGAKNEVNQLGRAQATVISLVEQQQAILLQLKIAEAEALAEADVGPENGEQMELDGVDDVEEYCRLLDELRAEQMKRTKLVGEYTAALADRGVGEKADMYRKLTAKCLGLDEQEVDERIDGLLEVLEEENDGAE